MADYKTALATCCRHVYCVVGIAVVVASLTKARKQGKLFKKKWDFFLYRFRPKNRRVGWHSWKVTLSIQSLRLFDQFLCSKDYNRTQPKEWTGCPLKPEILINKWKKNLPTDVMQLSYETNLKAAAVVNKLMSLYVENNLLSNQLRLGGGWLYCCQLLKPRPRFGKQKWLCQFKEQNQVVALRRSQIGSSGY